MCYLEFVPHADETKFPSFLFGIPVVVGVSFEQLPDKLVLGLADQRFEGHVQSIVVLFHKLPLKRQPKTEQHTCFTAPATEASKKIREDKSQILHSNNQQECVRHRANV